jgi:hypothetical protein
MRRCAGRARVKHVDETGWARAARWLLAAVTASGVAAFALCHARTYAGVRRRGRKVLDYLEAALSAHRLGQPPPGVFAAA